MTETALKKRNSRRFAVSLPVTFIGSDKGVGIVHNLSRGGCQMESMADITTRDSLIMHLSLSPDEAPLTIQAANVRRGDERRFNVAFLVMDTKEQERLRRYLSDLEHKAP